MTDAKPRVVKQISLGKSVSEAMASVGRSVKTYEAWRHEDKSFDAEIRHIRQLRKLDADSKRAMHVSDFETFRQKFLGMRTFEHQRQWIDLIEGREPEDLHPSIRYEKGDPNFVLVNCPPEHSKSVTLSIDYPTYRICVEPSERIIIVSETQSRAKEFLYAIKQRLTHPRYHALHLAYGPPDGFQATADAWRQDLIYLGNELRDSPEKDPTIQAIGVGGQIYGARSNLIILDDVVVLSNAHQFEPQLKWIQQEVLTRLGPGGKLIIAGTRVDAIDLYRELRNPDRYPEGRSPWSYLAQPAVLDFAEKSKDWKTLWPRSDHPWPGLDDKPDSDGLYPRWTGQHLARRRNLLDPRTWSMVYQQSETAESAIFDPSTVRACVNGNRTVGRMSRDNAYHREAGMDGLYVICSMDPAMAGETATIAYALDLKTHQRYVLDSHRMRAPSPQRIRDIIQAWTTKYEPQTWVIEKNAFQLFLTRDEEIRSFLASRGVIMREHYCVDTETQALSKRGWLSYDQVKPGEEILTLNTSSGASEWKPVLETFTGEYAGPMHRIEGRFIDCLCTPDHRWPAHRQGEDLLRLTPSAVLTTGDWTPLARPMSQHVDQRYDDDFVRLVGWAVTEGHFRKVGTSIQIGQSPTANPDHCESIRLALKGCQATWTERDNGSGTLVFSVTGSVASRIRSVTLNGKNLPPSFVVSLTRHQRVELLKVLIDADGWRSGKIEHLCSNSDSILQGFEMLCAMEGSSTFRAYRSSDPQHGVVSRRASRDSRVQPRIDEIQWSGRIWCPRTENGTFYARRAGRTYFTGNTARNKLDPDFGIASLAPLFEQKLIELPSSHNHEATKALVEQLVTWSPGKAPDKLIQDLPMALWFADLIARELIDARTQHTKQHRDSKFVPRYRRKDQAVVRLDEYLAGRDAVA